MKTFRVIVTRDVTESTMIEPQAESADQANDKALEIARTFARQFNWTRDDSSEDDPYLGDPEGAEEVDES